MPRAPKQCAGCTALVVARTYCDECLLHRRRIKPLSPTAQQRDDDNTERQRRKATVNAWVRQHGWVCPGWERDPHPSRDLTAAHATAVAEGGGKGPLTVLCRSCNSRQGTRSSSA